MRNYLKIGIQLLLLLLSGTLNSQSYHVRFAFIGNSITIGSGLSNPAVQCYPSQLNLLLQAKYGDTCIVTNYAVSGRTMLKKGDYPWWKEPDFTRCWNAAPDICFIMLGTNDSKPYNWDVFGNEYFGDYQSMLDTFRLRNPAVRFIICRPPPAFGVAYDIRPQVISEQVIPLIDSIIKMNDPVVVNFYDALLDSAYLFPDKIHPNAAGAKVFAQIAFDAIVASDIVHQIPTGHPFVTSINSSVPGELRISDSATISWTTINATEVYFDGMAVDPNGSVKVGPDSTTRYTLIAKNDSASDSLTFIQKIYFPELASITAVASVRNFFLGDTITLSVNFYDQNKRLITDSIYEVNWSVTQGKGHFINSSGRTIQFVADTSGTLRVKCSRDAMSYFISLSVKNNPAAEPEIIRNKSMTWFPNPMDQELNLVFDPEKSGVLLMEIYNEAGKLCQSDHIQYTHTGKQSVKINTTELKAGLYIVKVRMAGKTYSQKIMKK